MIDFLKLEIDILDNDHQRFFEIFEQIENEEIAIIDAIPVLKEYSLVHFAHEENIMLLLNYPDYTFHKSLHTEFIRKIESIECSKTELVNVLRKWLLYHISLYDYALAQFIKEYLKTAESLKEII